VIATQAALEIHPGDFLTLAAGNGTLSLNNVAVTLNQEIAVGDLGTLTYTPNSNYSGSDAFGWNGSDGTQYAVSGASVNLTVRATTFDASSADLSSVPFIAASAGTVQVICVAESTWKDAAATVPKATAVAPVKPAPVMITEVLPAAGPVVVPSEVTVGAAT